MIRLDEQFNKEPDEEELLLSSIKKGKFKPKGSHSIFQKENVGVEGKSNLVEG